MTTAKLQGLSFAGKVADSKDPWSDFGGLRNDFLKLDNDSARMAALEALVDSGDATMRSFAKALGEASGISVSSNRQADRIAENILRPPPRTSSSESAPAPRAAPSYRAPTSG